MRHFCRSGLMAVAVIALGAAAFAQQPPKRPVIGVPPQASTGRPVTSPYLFLLPQGGFNRTRGGNFAFDYFRQIRPEIDFRRTNATQFQQINELQRNVLEQREILQSPTSQLGPTGHVTSFQNFGRYFPAAN